MHHLTTAARILTEITLGSMIILAQIAEIAVASEKVTSDELLLLWCLIGGLCGSFCSLRFFQPQRATEAVMQFGVNLCFATIVSPQACYVTSAWTGWPIGLRLALPVALVIGTVACNLVAIVLPYGERWFRGRAAKVSDDK